MMKLSTRSSYGLRAAIALAMSFEQAPQTAAVLAEANHIPRRYLEQILNRLRHGGLVEASRGPRGGYRLALSPPEISVGDIVRAVEGDIEPVLCSIPEHRSAQCRTVSRCISRRLCHQLESTLVQILDGTTLEDLRREAHHAQTGAAVVPVAALTGQNLLPEPVRGLEHAR